MGICLDVLKCMKGFKIVVNFVHAHISKFKTAIFVKGKHTETFEICTHILIQLLLGTRIEIERKPSVGYYTIYHGRLNAVNCLRDFTNVKYSAIRQKIDNKTFIAKKV